MTLPTEFFRYKNGTLCAEDVSLIEIAEALGTPVYVYSKKAFLDQLKEFAKGLKGLDSLICFAVKSNSNIGILKMLGEAGAGVDLVSGGELFRAQAAGIPADRVVFSGVGKSPGEMARALEYDHDGILSFNVESEGELEILSVVASHMNRKARVTLRFNPDVNAKTHPYISTGLKKNKFGMNRTEVLRILRNLNDYPGIEIRGLSIHIGSQMLSLAPIEDAFRKTRELLEEVHDLIPGTLSWIDLGGGMGITYKTEKSPRIGAYCKLIQKYFSKAKLKIIIEPGRAISGNAGALITEVLYRKDRKDKCFLIVDAAMNDLIRPSLYGSYHEILPVVKKRGGKSRKMDVVGPVCETGDCFASARPLPDSLESGDVVAILSAGAYGFSMSSNYNSRPRPPEVLVDGSRFEVIRDRESYEDLIRGEVSPGRTAEPHSPVP